MDGTVTGIRCFPTMIEEQGTIVCIEDDIAWVEPVARSACGGCAARSSCGSGVLAGAFRRRTAPIRVNNRIAARTGDRVVIGIGEMALIKSALLLYLLPLLGMMAAGLWGQWLGTLLQVEHLQVLIATTGLAGLAGSLWLVHRHTVATSGALRSQPIMLRRIKA